MKITPEIREKVFVQYWGQKVLLIAPGLIEYVGTNWNLKHDSFKLLLRPLSAITDVERRELICLMEGLTKYESEDIYRPSNYFLNAIEGRGYEVSGAELIKLYQWLISKGFDFPNFHLSGKTLHEAGLAKHTNEI